MKKIKADKKGNVLLKEEPRPALRGSGVLVRNKYSFISIGTEISVIRNRRKDSTNSEDSLLGYSSVGVVIEKGKEVSEVKIGDFVACAGAGYASHQEVSYIPRNLFAKIPEGVDLKEAVFTTLGAIAMHGVRRAEIELGETVAVIGLGVIGQIVCQLASISGAKVIGVDLNDKRLEISKKLSGCITINPESEKLTEIIKNYTNGIGVDTSIICANSPKSSKPLIDAIEIAGDRGRIVMVGNVELNFPRNTFYQKELELLISRSYGPGRYDSQYEEKGIDYPLGYVRWTENRNIQEFLRLLKTRKISMSPLITHEFPFNKAPEVYNEILESKEEFLGVILSY